MMKIFHLFIYSLLSLSFACGVAATSGRKTTAKPAFILKNPSDMAKKDAEVLLDAGDLAAKYPSIDWNSIKFTSNGDVPFQANDHDGNGQVDQFVLILDLGPNEEKTIAIETLAAGVAAPVFKKRTQAELSHKINGNWKEREYEGGEFKNVNYIRVPPEHKDHSWFIRYEGPGWESDLIGYRFYLDQRNATDVFGKKTSEMVLQNVGLDGFDSYHEPSDWGMDVLKVGPSLGVGSLGTWMGDHAQRVEKTDSLTCEILVNGALESKLRTKYYGWKAEDATTTVTSDLSIHAGSRLTRHDVSLTDALPNLCTGIVKDKNGAFFKNNLGNWGYIATWGPQSLAKDHLGLAVLFNKDNLLEITEDDHSHVVVLNPTGNQLTYYFLGAWEQETGGIKTQENFIKYLDEVVEELNKPVEVEF